MTKRYDPTKPLGYESKPSGYFAGQRPEMLQFVPPHCKRVLDVGCGRGGFGELLKQSREIEVWGIEPVTTECAIASCKLDRVVEGIFSPDAELPAESFDAVIFNDVLEHLFDPESALRLAQRLLRSGGAVVASIPNIRHLPTIWEIVVRGEWTYQDSGILDRTHLRFFTRRSILAMFNECGFITERIEGINRGSYGKKGALLHLLNFVTAGALTDMHFLQFAVIAKCPIRSDTNRK